MGNAGLNKALAPSGASISQALAQAEQERWPVALCTVVRSQGSTPRGAASKMLVYSDGRLLGTVGGGELENRTRTAALKSLQDGQAALLSYNMTDPQRGDPGVCGGQVEVFVEPILPAPTLLLVGAGHVGKAVAALAAWLGFYVVVSDDRAEFCTPEATPGGQAYYAVPLAELPQQMKIDERTYIVLTTRGASVDVAGLPALLHTPAAYIGVIGSRRRWAETCKQLLAAGVSQAQLAQVHSPVGLELQAETPEEIAVSIMAEILMLRGQADGKPMKKMETNG